MRCHDYERRVILIKTGSMGTCRKGMESKDEIKMGFEIDRTIYGHMFGFGWLFLHEGR